MLEVVLPEEAARRGPDSRDGAWSRSQMISESACYWHMLDRIYTRLLGDEYGLAKKGSNIVCRTFERGVVPTKQDQTAPNREDADADRPWETERRTWRAAAPGACTTQTHLSW